MKKFVLALLSTALLVTACASSDTPYMPARSEEGFGYHESALGGNRYRVTFAGNSSTSSDKVQDYTLLRAAELTVHQGYDWFAVASRDTATVEQREPAEISTSVAYTSVPMVETRCGLLTCSSRYSSYPTLETRIDTPDRNRRTYTSMVEIVMGEDKDDAPEEAYDARELIGVIRARM